MYCNSYSRTRYSFSVCKTLEARQLKLAGDSRTFGSWNMTILNDTNFKLYKAFERWMNGINNMTDNEGVNKS